MEGYKALLKGLYNRYGFQYELNKKYELNGELKWNKNGFHFCKRPEDTLRYVDPYKDEIEIAKVIGSKEIVLYEDDYYGYYDMYASSEIELIGILKREEFFSNVINSRVPDRVSRMVSLMPLTDDEIEIVRTFYPNLEFYINYYQNKEYILKKRV